MSHSDDAVEQAAIDVFRRLLEAERDGRAEEREVLLGDLPPDVRERVEELLADLALLRQRRTDMGGGPTDGMRLGPYRLLRRLGQGGASTVWEAVDTRLSRSVAVKVLHPHLALSDRQIERFTREARLAAGLAHPHVCPVHDVGEDDGLHYLVQELVPDGRTLFDLLAERRGALGGPTEVRELATLMYRVCEAVAEVHARGIVHRDLKPNNILLRPDDTPLVSDFGLASLTEGEDLGPASIQAGTPFYLAPEQFAARGTVSVRSDVFALGVTLYECLTGRRPFEGDSSQVVARRIAEQEPEPLRRLHPRLPRDLETICLVALEKDPERRYADAGAMAADLRRFLRGESIAARPVGRARRVLRAARRRPVRTVAVALGVALPLLSLGFSAKLAERNRLLVETLAASREAAAYMAPGREAERTAEPPAFLARLAQGGREVLARRPGDLADQLAVVAEFYAELGFFDRAAELEGEAAAALEAVEPDSRRALELRIAQLRALDYDFRTDEALDLGSALLERAAAVGDPVDLALVRLTLSASHAFAQDFEALRALDARFGPAVEHAAAAVAATEEAQDPVAFLRRVELRRLLSRVLRATQDFEAASDAAEAAFDECVERYGPNHYRTILVGQQFASCLGRLRAMGIEHPRWTALEFDEYLLPIAERVLGPTNRVTIEVRWRLAEVQFAERRLDAALGNYAFVVRELERWVGPENPRRLSVRIAHALVLIELGRVAEALAEIEAVIPIRTRVVGPDHYNTLVARRARAQALTCLGRREEAFEDLADQWERFTRIEGAPGINGLIETYSYVASQLSLLDRLDELDGWVARTVERLERVAPERVPEVLTGARAARLRDALARRDVDRARALLAEGERAAAGPRPSERPMHPSVPNTARVLLALLAGDPLPRVETHLDGPEAESGADLGGAAYALLAAYARGDLELARQRLERVDLDLSLRSGHFLQGPDRLTAELLERLPEAVERATQGAPTTRERALVEAASELLARRSQALAERPPANGDAR